MSVGRPRWTPDKEAIEKVEALAAHGLTREQIADCLGISYQTLNEKCKEYSEFSDAFIKGKAKGIAQVTQALLKNVAKGNVTAQIFFLKAQAGWIEAKPTTINPETKSLLEELIDKL